MSASRYLVLRQREISREEFNATYKGLYGYKGAGLLCLPSPWCPQYFLISTKLYQRYCNLSETMRLSLCRFSGVNKSEYGAVPVFKEEGKVEGMGSETLLFEHILSPEEEFHVENALREIAETENDFVIVRSSGTHENLEWRGCYRSVYCRANIKEFALAIQQVFVSSSENAKSSMGVVVQRYINTQRARGHLSNERRISRNISSWLCEFDTISGIGSPRVLPFSSARKEVSECERPLLCYDRESLIQMFKQVGTWAQSQKLRLHFEWIWDGSRMWVVQADQALEREREYPSLHKKIVGKGSKPLHLSVLVPEQELSKGTWKKIDCIKTFRECRLPVPEVWVLHDRDILLALQAGKFPRYLKQDMEELLKGPVVVRTDISGGDNGGKLMLARTDTVTDIDELRDFLFRETGKLSKNAIEQMEVCFIFHRFIPARSSAFALAEAGKKKVRIDGLWGLPDGLTYYPHDSYELSYTGTNKISKRIRFKEEYLDTNEKGEWVEKHAGRPLDWKSSLEEEELRVIAKGTFAIACEIGAPVEVMWFVGIPAGLGLPKCLPWYYSTEEPPKSLFGRKKCITERAFLVRKQEDIERLKCEEYYSGSLSGIRLRPVPKLLRSRDFIQRVAELAKHLSVPVELEGSVLSHAYYLLKRYGATVICSDPFRPEYRRRQFNKLVRDLIPIKITSGGEKVRVTQITGNELTSVLKAKAVEEALELFWAESIEQSKEEIVDLLEVLKWLAKHQGFEEEEMRAISDRKCAERGSFEKGLILKETQEIPLIREAIESKSLFDDVEPWDEVEKRDSRARRKTSATGSLPRKEGPKVVIPLVPPDPSFRHFGHSIPIRNAGVTINVRFGEKDIILEVTEFGKEYNTHDPRQLRLFDV